MAASLSEKGLGEFPLHQRKFQLAYTLKTDATLIISNENIFFKTQGCRLRAIVTSKKGLE